LGVEGLCSGGTKLNSIFIIAELLQKSSGDSRPDLSFDKSASPERLFSLARVSLAEASKPVLSFGCSGGDCTSSCPPSLVSAKLAYAMVWRHPHAAIDDPRPCALKPRDMLPFYRTPPVTADVVILKPTPEDVAAGTPSFKILAKAKASHKRKASTSGATSGHVAKRTRSTLAQSPGSTTRPNLFVGDSDNENGRSSAALAAEVSHIQDSRGKGIMVNDVVVPSGGASRLRPSNGPAPSFKDVFGDAIHTDFFPFSASQYYATYLEGGVAGNCEFTYEEWDAPYRPTFGVLTKEVSRLNDKLATSDASFAKYKAKGMKMKKKIKSLTKNLVQNFLASDEFSRVQVEVLSLAASAGFERGLSMHRTKDEFDVVLKMVNFMPGVQDRLAEASPLSAYVNFTASAVVFKHNEEMINTEVDGSDPKMTDDTVVVKSKNDFMQGISVALDDVTKLVEILSHATRPKPNGFPLRLAV
nr:hypothetical protein [Tanacetum cinerariifolium]